MTVEEMADKHAEEYVKHWIVGEDDNALMQEAYKDGFLDGLKAGRPQWHKVLDGDLPDEDVYVYLWFRGEEYPIVARRHLFKEWGRLKWCWDCQWGSGYTIEADNDRIIAWKEIVLPKRRVNRNDRADGRIQNDTIKADGKETWNICNLSLRHRKRQKKSV